MDINFKEKILKPKKRNLRGSFVPEQVTINSTLLKTKPTSNYSKMRSSVNNDNTTLNFESNTVTMQSENKIYLARISGK